MIFDAIYYDRNERLKAPVEVRFDLDGLIVSPNNNENEPEIAPFRVNAAEILKADSHSDGSLILEIEGRRFLEVHDGAAFKARFLEKFPFKKALFARRFLDRRAAIGCLIALAVAALPLLFLWKYGSSWLADRLAERTPIEQERKIGQAWLSSVVEQYREDTAASELAQLFFDSLRFETPYPIAVRVVREPVLNAFAVPGGHIVVFDSLLNTMSAPEELAGLLAHETSHITERHSLKSVYRSLSNSLIVSALLGDFAGASDFVMGQAAELSALSYSRSLETEADLHGIELLKKSGVPTNGMASLFKKMKATASKADSNFPSFLSTHPAMDERIEALSKADPPEGGQPMMRPSLAAIFEALKQKTR